MTRNEAKYTAGEGKAPRKFIMTKTGGIALLDDGKWYSVNGSAAGIIDIRYEVQPNRSGTIAEQDAVRGATIEEDERDVRLECGHTIRVHAASSTFDFPDDENYCDVCRTNRHLAREVREFLKTAAREPMKAPEAASDGNIVVAAKNNGTVEIWWHNTPHNTNNLTIVERSDARSLYAMLGVVLGEMETTA